MMSDETVLGGVWTGVHVRPLPPSLAMTEPFAEFYRLHYPGAVRLAWLLTHDHACTEDIVQNAFIRLRPKFDEVLDRPAYLRVCVVNGCRDDGRSAARRAARLRLVSNTEPTASFDAPSELGDAVSSLPYKQRVVIVLRYWADLPEREIAEIIGVRPGTVRTLAARALATLRKDLSQ